MVNLEVNPFQRSRREAGKTGHSCFVEDQTRIRLFYARLVLSAFKESTNSLTVAFGTI